MKPIIRVDNLSKQYRIGGSRAPYATLRESINRAFKNSLGWTNRNGHGSNETIWALRGVSFEIHQGEVVGIIGRNGAGKSTLLKILSRITEPTEGQVDLYGRVGSLLEVGVGFHPELTGRENIYLNGAILGMRGEEIDRRFDEIVAFAEVEKFIDTSVKHYSSGMYLRLAFAVAAHLDPEILIVDEVLAVGDAAFQKKCIGKMQDVASEGRTVLLVSHNMQTVSTLTQRSLMLSRGRCVRAGNTNDVITEYIREGAEDDLVYIDSPSDSEPMITKVELRTSEPGNVQLNGESMDISFEITTPGPINGASLSFQACDALQRPVLHLWSFDSERPMGREAGRFKVTCHIPKVRLYIGRYTLTVHFSERAGGRKFQTIQGVCPFEVVLYGRHREFEWQPGTCAYLEDCEWYVEPGGDT